MRYASSTSMPGFSAESWVIGRRWWVASARRSASRVIVASSMDGHLALPPPSHEPAQRQQRQQRGLGGDGAEVGRGIAERVDDEAPDGRAEAKAELEPERV